MQRPGSTADQAGVARWLARHGIEGVHFRVPTIDGRLIGKFVHTRQFMRVASAGIRLHPACPHRRPHRSEWNGSLPPSWRMSPSCARFRSSPPYAVSPGNRALHRFSCPLDDADDDEPADQCVRGALARAHNAFATETGLRLDVGIEPEVIGPPDSEWIGATSGSHRELLRRLGDARLRAVLLDLVRTCDALGIAVTEASSEVFRSSR